MVDLSIAMLVHQRIVHKKLASFAGDIGDGDGPFIDERSWKD